MSATSSGGLAVGSGRWPMVEPSWRTLRHLDAQSVIVRQDGRTMRLYRTITGAMRRAEEDAGLLGCPVPDMRDFVRVLEEGGTVTLTGERSIVTFRPETLLE